MSLTHRFTTVVIFIVKLGWCATTFGQLLMFRWQKY